MNIVLVTPFLPVPAMTHAGGQDVWQTLAGLRARGHRLHVIAYERGEAPEQRAALGAVVDSLATVRPAYRWREKMARLVRGGWRQPRQLGQHTHRLVREQIAARCCAEAVDVVHLAWTEMGRYADAVPPGVGALLRTYDAEYVVRPREVRLLRPGPVRWRVARRARRLVRIEARAVVQVDVVVAASAFDQRALGRLVEVDRVRVVAPWFDGADLMSVSPATRQPGRLVYVGALDRAANQAAVRWLLARVWPRIRRDDPDAQLHIVGVHPPRWLLRRAAGDARLHVPGFAADLCAEWAAADVALLPAPVGGGLVTKVALALAAGRPVVTTTGGNMGLAAPPGEALLVADDLAAFAAGVLRLRRDAALWQQLATAGRAMVAPLLDWSAQLDRLELAYDAARHRAKERATWSLP